MLFWRPLALCPEISIASLLNLMIKAIVIICFPFANHSTDIISPFHPHCHPLKEGDYLHFTDDKTEAAQRASLTYPRWHCL